MGAVIFVVGAGPVERDPVLEAVEQLVVDELSAVVTAKSNLA
jgi:hypothetical protein